MKLRKIGKKLVSTALVAALGIKFKKLFGREKVIKKTILYTGRQEPL